MGRKRKTQLNKTPSMASSVYSKPLLFVGGCLPPQRGYTALNVLQNKIQESRSYRDKLSIQFQEEDIQISSA